MIKCSTKVIIIFILLFGLVIQSVFLAKFREQVALEQGTITRLQSDNSEQSLVISRQTFDFARFNQASMYANQLNSIIDITKEESVIKIREKLRYEKTCNYPLPDDISNELLSKANKIRSSALHSDTSSNVSANDSSTTTVRLTYCQAVLWITPLLAEIEKGNNQLKYIGSVNYQSDTSKEN